MARSINGLHLLVLGGAGVAACYVTAHLSSAITGDSGSVVAPALRARQAAAPPSEAGGGLPASPAAALVGSSLAPAEKASAPRRGNRAEAIPGDTGQPFAAMSWLPPPPPPLRPIVAAAAPPAPPVAPPLPFNFVGLMEKGTPQPHAFLSRGDELLVVGQGDLLGNGAYRVDVVGPDQIVLMHLPTQTKQVIYLSGGSR